MKQVFYVIRTKRNNTYWYVEKVLSPDNFLIHTSHQNNAKKFISRDEAVKFFNDHFVGDNELGFSVVWETRNVINPIHLFNMFSLNYPHDFIQKVWANSGEAMIGHIDNKFSAAYKKAGASGVMLKFWCELDTRNRELLENWILENYNG